MLSIDPDKRLAAAKPVVIYTDGACLGNPGPGGYAAVLLQGRHRKELSGGYRRTTNNRMEIMAAIAALELLKHRCTVALHTDSQYVQQSVSLGWARRWQSRGWKHQDGKRLNWDLWERLLAVCAKHDVTFAWVRGLAGTPDLFVGAAFTGAAFAGADFFATGLAGAVVPLSFAQRACWAAAIRERASADMVRTFALVRPCVPLALLTGPDAPSKPVSFACRDSICPLI